MNGPSEELKQRVRENQNKLKNIKTTKTIDMKAKDTIIGYCTKNNIDNNRELIDDEVIELMDLYANQIIVEELENIKSKINIINFYDIIDKRIKELKLAEEVDDRSLLEREHPDFPINRKELKQK